MKRTKVFLIILISLFLVSFLNLPGQENNYNIKNLSANSETNEFSIISKSLTKQLTSPPNDPFFNNQWTLAKINAQQAWSINTGNSNITIAVIDNGIDMNHEEFTGQLVSGYDYFDNDSSPQASGDYNHGNACAGIISAKANNGVGIVGLAYNCKIMPLRINNVESGWDENKLKDAINFAKDSGADIISISLQSLVGLGDGVVEAINNAVTYGRNGKGCIVVVSAGNAGDIGQLMYPAQYANSFSVGATDHNDLRWNYSCKGNALRIVAPSGNHPVGDIWTTDIMGAPGQSPTNYVNNFGATSAAAPLVAGLAALIISKDPWLTRNEVQTIIEQTAIDLGAPGRDNDYGWGRIDAWNALRITTSGTLPGHEVWRGTINLTGNVTVPSNVKLAVLSNAVINLNGYSIISSSGKITVENGATINGLRAKLGHQGQNGLCGTIQTAIDNSNLNNNIYVQSGIFNENITIANKSSIIYVYGDNKNNTIINGNISIVNSYYPQLYYITTNYIGVSGCTNARVEEVIITPWSEDAEWSLMVNNCSPVYLGGVTLNDTPYGYGAYFSNSTGQVYQISQSRFENHEIATYFINSSSFTLSNVRFCNNGYDIVSDGTSAVLAQYVTFSGNPVNKTSGNVSWGTYYTCGLLKNSHSILISDDVKKDFAFDEFYKLNLLYQDLIAKINYEHSKDRSFTKENYSKEFNSIIAICKTFINGKTLSLFAPTVLNIAAHMYKQFKNYEGLKNFIGEINSNENLKSLFNNSNKLLIDYYTFKKDYKNALLTANGILNSKSLNEDLICDVLLSKGLLYEYSTGQIEEAIKIYKEMVSIYPKNGATKFAKQQLKHLGVIIKDESPKMVDAPEETIEFGSSNYPNPFNPETTISYTIPEDGKVQLKVFDILGREVTTLIDGFISAGKYTVKWDGSYAVSGVYLYRITYKNQILSKKMLLIK